MYHKLKKCLNCRSSHQRCSIEKFHNIHRKTPALESLFDKVAGAGLKTCNCIKRDCNKGFFCEYCENFKSTYFQENLQNNCFCSSYFLLLKFLIGFLLVLIQYLSSFQGPLQSLKSSPQVAQWQTPLLFEKKEELAEIATHCRCLLSFVVTGCTTRCHSLSLILPLVVTRCHSLSRVVARCTSRLSFYFSRLSSVVPVLLIDVFFWN